ncbi:MAG TPA: GNAT family protein [Thermomicrobiales bacterium]|jgi:RimJ/RimL family protein N-acetyltransferase|nr:GNAT family protein [Thermomicrobiales bacterium]
MPYPTYQTLIPLPPEVRGDRVLVRPYRPDDAAGLIAAINESRAELNEWMAWAPHQRTLDDALDYCLRMAAAWIRREDLAMGVFDAASGRYLGGTGFHRIDWQTRSFEIGYWLRTSAVGQGLMTEAVGLLLEVAFEVLDARRVEIRCDAQNHRSAAIPRRLGFTIEGTLRKEGLTPAGEVRDTLVFGIIDDDYRGLMRPSGAGEDGR